MIVCCELLTSDQCDATAYLLYFPAKISLHQTRPVAYHPQIGLSKIVTLTANHLRKVKTEVDLGKSNPLTADENLRHSACVSIAS